MKNYIIYGVGISGVAAVKFLLQHNHKIIVTDDNDNALKAVQDKLSREIFQHQENIIFTNDVAKYCNKNSIIVFAPGIPLYYPKRHKILQIVEKTGARLLCDIELFYLLRTHPESFLKHILIYFCLFFNKISQNISRYLSKFYQKNAKNISKSEFKKDSEWVLNRQKNFLGITGTNGKSTTTALTGFILNQLKIDAKIGGNIGVPCFELEEAQNYVFEVSSYQLDLMHETHFKTAALTNITPDHIDRHGSFAEYVLVKKKIFCNQKASDFAIIGVDNEVSRAVFDELKSDPKFVANLIPISTRKIYENGISVINGMLYSHINQERKEFELKNLILKGEHNMQNIAIAFANVYCAFMEHFSSIELQQKIIDAILCFKGLRHRMQFLGNIDGVNFINDSKATNAESSEPALKSYENIFWILGGKPKDGGISGLKPYFSKITKAYLIGEASDQFASLLQENKIVYEKCGDLNKAFESAYLDAKNSSLKEKNILLSPSCASFDQWKNFEERGDYFCKKFDEINQSRKDITAT